MEKLSQQERSLLQWAYEECCQTYCPAGFDRPFTPDLASLLDRLLDMTSGDNPHQPIVRFVAVLVNNLSPQSPPYQDLRTWGETQTLAFAQLLTEMQKRGEKKSEFYLMVRVKPRSQKPGYYSVAAALVRDPDPSQPDAETTYEGLLSSEDCLPEELPALPQKIFDSLNQRQKQREEERQAAPLREEYQPNHLNLTVKWFLPQDLLDMNVDQWKIRSGDGNRELPIGTQYRVVIRSLERDLPRYDHLKKNGLKAFWLRLSQNQQAPCGELLASGNGDLVQLCKEMKGSQFLGCRFVIPADRQQQKFVFEELIDSALPFAVWVRRTFAEPEVEAAIQPVLAKRLGQLPLSVKDMRDESRIQAGLGQSDRVGISTHLSLLWDNPFRPFPDIVYEDA